MTCIEKIIGSRIDLKRYINSMKSKDVKVNKAKPKEGVKFREGQITPSMIINLFTEKNGTDHQIVDDIMSEHEDKKTIQQIVKDGKNIIPSFWKKVRGLGKMSRNKMTIFSEGHETNDDITSLILIQKGFPI